MSPVWTFEFLQRTSSLKLCTHPGWKAAWNNERKMPVSACVCLNKEQDLSDAQMLSRRESRQTWRINTCHWAAPASRYSTEITLILNKQHHSCVTMQQPFSPSHKDPQTDCPISAVSSHVRATGNAAVSANTFVWLLASQKQSENVYRQQHTQIWGKKRETCTHKHRVLSHWKGERMIQRQSSS